MVEDHNVKEIYAVCKLFENNRPKCHQYWPDMNPKDASKFYNETKIDPSEMKIETLEEK